MNTMVTKNLYDYDDDSNEEFNNVIERYEKKESYNEETMNAVAMHYKGIIDLLESEPTREGVIRTPIRAAKAMQFLTHGYDMDPSKLLKGAMFQEDHKHMVIVKDIEIYSMCEHHMLPFFGKAHIAYIPNGWIVGLSKIPRVADAFASGHQLPG